MRPWLSYAVGMPTAVLGSHPTASTSLSLSLPGSGSWGSVGCTHSSGGEWYRYINPWQLMGTRSQESLLLMDQGIAAACPWDSE